MTEKIRVGILGCANIAKRSVAPAFLVHPGFELKAIASRTHEKADAFIKDLKCACQTLRSTSYDALVEAEDIDLIYCPLPTGMHYEWVKKCLKSGKHVLCEKSLACNFSEVKNLVDIARANNLFLMESFQFRFHAQNLYVKELLANNKIGPVHQVVVRFGIPPFPEGATNIRYSASLGGGAFLDNGAYTLKCTTYLLGKDNVRLLAAMESGATPELGNVNVVGSLMLSVGDISVQTAYGFDHFYQNSYEIWGKDGKISTVRAFTAREDFAAPVIVETKTGKDVRMFKDDHFAKMLDHVLNAILTKRFLPEYEECLVQARLIEDAKRIGGVR